MASVAIPIQKIRVDSTLSTTLSRSSALPSFIRKPLKLWLFRKVLHLVNSSLSGERLGSLTQEQAHDLYGPLNQFYIELINVLAKMSERPLVERKLMKWWIDPVTAEVEQLGEIVETLGWGADEKLRGFIDAAVEEINSRA